MPVYAVLPRFGKKDGEGLSSDGKGEPVEWILCRIGVYEQSAEFGRLTGGKRWEGWEKQDSPHGQSVS